MNDLTVALLTLRDAREAEATTKQALKEKSDAFEATITDLVGAATDAGNARELAEATVRGLAVAVYLESGNKAPAKGVTVVESSKLKYDAAEAFKWATEHNLCLSLDAKAFEKTAKATPLPFVTTEVTPAARIATDLSDLTA